MRDDDELEKIWCGDRLERKKEAATIEAFIVDEVEFFAKTRRDRSVVLAIDAPYGSGKSWFLERFAKQLKLSHPVAVVDAWADDAGDEPLTAFMAAIDDALAPYLSTSKKLGDRLAAAKASALPVMGKLLSGAAIKIASKIAGDEIEDHVGDAIEAAVRGAKVGSAADEDGAAAEAMTAALEKLGAEIDNLVDRRGAAMLAAYRQRRESREVFRENMRQLVSSIDSAAGPGSAPLIVVIDELDRCRPSYAIRVLEEVKHFFDIPQVVFIVALHGGQLSKSVRAVYGADFESDDYLRRFFTRRYELKSVSIVDLVVSLIEDWGIDGASLSFPDMVLSEGVKGSESQKIGLLLADWSVKPREVYAILDGLRLFLNGWSLQQPIETVALMQLLVKMVRGQSLDFVALADQGLTRFRGIRWQTANGGSPIEYGLQDYARALNAHVPASLEDIALQTTRGHDPASNYIVESYHRELQLRQSLKDAPKGARSHLADYAARISELARFVEMNSEGEV